MAKKKKNSLHDQKIDKAHHRNEFLSRLAKFCDAVAGIPTFHLIPSSVTEKIYMLRMHPPRLRPAYGMHVSDEVMHDAKMLLSILFKNDKINIGIGQVTEMSLYDFYTLGSTLTYHVQQIKLSDYPHAATVREKLSVLLSPEVAELQEHCMKRLGEYANIVPLYYSDLLEYLLAIKLEVRAYVEGRLGVVYCIDLYARKTEVQTFKVEGTNRPAYRVGYYLSSDTSRLSFVGIKPEQIFLPPGKEMPVYIQMHALDRLGERLDDIITSILFFNLYASLTALKARKNRKGELLFEFSLFGKKVGYFVALVIGQQILLRTFLFLTNNGTPEGEKLHSNTGIMKDDKIFLQIDKLSTFLESDIKNNERLKAIFIDAGCASLFEVGLESSNRSSGDPLKVMADYISNYLKKDR